MIRALCATAVATALALVAAVVTSGEPSDTQAAIDTTASLRDAVAQAQADAPHLWDEASRARAEVAVQQVARGGVR